MTKFLFIFILFISHHAISQESFLEMKIEQNNIDPASEEFLKKMYFFVGKDFDSVDIQLLANGPTIGAFIVQSTFEEKELTYGHIYEMLLTIKINGGETYQQIKTNYITLQALKLLPATLDNWNEMKRVLLKSGSDPEKMNSMNELMVENLDSTMNLSEVIGEIAWLLQDLEKDSQEETMEDFNALLSNTEAIDFEKSKMLATEADLPLLLYFTGYGCVNCRKLEESVLKDPEIVNSLLKDFILVPIYVDSQKELSPELKGTCIIGAREYEIETAGDYNRCFQISKFNLMSQPFLVFMNSEGEILSTADYENNSSVESMEKVLEEVLEKFYE